MSVRKHKRSVKTLLAALLLAALCLGMTACGQEKQTGASLRDGETFTVAVSQKADLNPFNGESGLAQEFFLLAYDSLWRLDESGEAQPCLAEDWSLSSDKLTWTIRLRQDVTFSDGMPLTSADVQYSYELLRRSDAYAEYFDGITAIRAPDEYTVVISTEYVKSDMMYNPAPILPRHIWREYESSPGSFDNAEMIGSGPFVFCPEESGEDGWMFRGRADHFDQTAKIGAVYFAYYGTVTGAARALAAGEADASFGLTDVQLTTLEGVPGVQLIQAMLPGSECQGIAFNTRSIYFNSTVMRQAIEYCADRALYVLMSSGDTGTAGSSFVSPGAEYFAAPSSIREYNTNQALSCLVSAGYSDSNKDGILEFRDGQPISLTLYTSSQDEWASTAATILCSDLEQLGVQVNWKKTDQSVEQVCTPKGSWDFCMISWQGSVDAPLTALRFYEDIGGLTGWVSPEYESLLAQLRTASELTATGNFAGQLQQRVYDECPVVVLSYSVDIQAVRNNTWTGFEEILDAAGGLFGIGSAAIYMKITPVEEAAE